MSKKESLNPLEFLYSAALDLNLICPTFPSGPTVNTGPTGSTELTGAISVATASVLTNTA
ncbi:TPA: hypothetical protein ACLQU7_004810 [Bacillus tropicus]|uniref:hypothetical protein n=1 Tax=Bacillus cereus group TaxID=86661 RepID=UPI000181CA10|nr:MULTISPECIES: hypothetical protein [Bacillus cereus group]AIY72983.1 hypothetical protein NT98_5806 [Bacillus cereus]AJI08070.1 hypothetical protein AQ16_5578 [Bacillus cereus G9241]QPS53439.1 hypothetical protein I6G54_28795 [Bacillus tropicus]